MSRKKRVVFFLLKKAAEGHTLAVQSLHDLKLIRDG